METTRAAPNRIAVIGAGAIGRRHIELIEASPRTTLAAIVDPDPRAGRLSEGLGVRWRTDLDELLRDERPDGAIVATPNALHREHAEACIAGRVPLLVEKPIATSVVDGERIAEAAEEHGVPVLVGHHRRHSPFLEAARTVISDGLLGDLVAVTATTMFAKPDDYFASAPWRREPGGGPILINLIHDVDAIRALAGDVDTVQSVVSSSVRDHAVEETAAVTLRFASGAVGTMLVSDAAASPVSWEMTTGEDPVYPRYPGQDCYLVAGTRGTLGIPTMRLTVADEAPSWHVPMRVSTVDVEPTDPLARQLGHFCDVIEGIATPRSPARDGVESLRVTLAIAEAAASGQTVGCAHSPAALADAP